MVSLDLSNALAGRGMRVLDRSVAVTDGAQFAAVETNHVPLLAVLANAEQLAPFQGETTAHDGRCLLIGARSAANLSALRRALSWLTPVPLGLRTSAGFGDRLGVATPGHIAAMRAAGGDICPIFAQQSIREMSRTGRSPQQVFDDASWGIFSQGWRTPFGADADHLKTHADVEACLPIGFTFWTIDPGDHVDGSAERAPPEILRRKFADLPWRELEDTSEAFLRRYAGATFEIEDRRLDMESTSVVRAAVKYGRAVAHTRKLFRLLRERLGSAGWELEVAVDETEHVTSHLEHVYMASELKRLGVQFVSYAPRYLGEFEKGVDYLGDAEVFEAHVGLHAAIARELGPYKLSLHSGSDKFSIFAGFARQTRGLAHLKTAGTSYVEALRTLASLDPALFRAIYVFAREQFETARVGYHISGRLERAPAPEALDDRELPALLDNFDARQILHVTFGQVLTWGDAVGRRPFRDGLLRVLAASPEAYAQRLKRHFAAHLAPFAAVAR